MKAEVFDVILTDPPYGMGADEFGDSGGLTEGAHAYKDDEEYFFTHHASICAGILSHYKVASTSLLFLRYRQI